MNNISTREKGARLERFIANEITASGLGKAKKESNSGAGTRKGDIASNLPFLIEAKNDKQVSILKNIDQTVEQARIGNYSSNKWALATRDPRYPEFERIYITIDFWEFLELMKKYSEPRVKKPDRELKWRLESLKIAVQRVIKELK